MHETGALRLDELLQLAVEFGEFGVVRDRIERLVVAGVTLVLPDVDESIAVTDFGAPRADKVDLFDLVSLWKSVKLPTFKTYLVLGHVRHTWVPVTHKLHILVHLARLHLMEDNAVHVLATSQHLGETALDVLVHLPALFGAIDQLG